MRLILGDCTGKIQHIVGEVKNPVIVTDPPFNIGYHYNKYKDNIPEDEYYEWLGNILSCCPSVIVHYPESLYKIAIRLGNAPERVVSWVYPSNTQKQHRDIAFFGVSPDMSKGHQPYKNPNDKRVKALIEKGSKGAKLYDWWEVNQVKNVSKEKTDHPCQMPLEVMRRIIQILPEDITVIDPFMGSGSTGVVCRELGKDFIGIEIDEKYFGIAQGRLDGDSSSE